MTSVRRPLLVILLALGLLIAGAAGVYYFFHFLVQIGQKGYHLLSDKERIKNFIDAFGPLGPVVFILIQTFQVVAAPIPGEATGFLGGFLFGSLPGFIYSTLGLTLGSTLAFLIGRWLEIHVVARLVKKETLEKFDFVMERQGTLVAFLLFLLPGFPKDYLCLILGLSPMPLKIFLIIVTFGRMPGTLMLSLQGAQVFKGNYYGSVIILALIIAVAIPMYIYREKIYLWLRKLSGHSPMPPNSPAKDLES